MTGDACFNNKLISLLSKEINHSTIFLAQVPHHGAKAEWEKFEKGNFKVQKYVISFGLGNSYHHPNKETVDSILSKVLSLISVTQNDGYIYWID